MTTSKVIAEIKKAGIPYHAWHGAQVTCSGYRNAGAPIIELRCRVHNELSMEVMKEWIEKIHEIATRNESIFVMIETTYGGPFTFFVDANFALADKGVADLPSWLRRYELWNLNTRIQMCENVTEKAEHEMRATHAAYDVACQQFTMCNDRLKILKDTLHFVQNEGQ